MTTPIVGPREQFDQRQQNHTRISLGELGEKAAAAWNSESVDPFRRIFYPLNRPQNVAMRSWLKVADGPLNPQRVEVRNPAKMSEIIKGVGKFLGASEVGICELDPAYVYSHRGLRIDFYKGRAGTPITLTHRYAISILIEMDYPNFRNSPGFIDDAAVGKGYLETAKVAVSLAGYIRELGYPAKAHFHLEEEVLHIPIAVMAGLGELARNGSMITRKYGPRHRLATVTTDLPLAVDQPVDLGVQKLCRMCTKCAVSCPVQAIPKENELPVIRGVQKWYLDNDACATYWTANWKRWNSCARCIAVCPWNRPWNRRQRLATWLVPRSKLARRLLLKLDDLLRGKRPNPQVEWLYYKQKGVKDAGLYVVE
ncbi:MAG: 4Fe-4S dicluster domain-containing protein [Candidatus Tectomicrobia bacterium]|nr:4Fe-4S dicluster domain-containing protein [Candidatus Tectomicrobia bacterium]